MVDVYIIIILCNFKTLYKLILVYEMVRTLTLNFNLLSKHKLLTLGIILILKLAHARYVCVRACVCMCVCLCMIVCVCECVSVMDVISRVGGKIRVIAYIKGKIEVSKKLQVGRK